MIRKSILFLIIGISVSAMSAQSENLFIARDFTREGLFSGNIEGPAFDKSGNLFVVNFAQDGTIGMVHMDGSAELFVKLPEGSIANSIQFDSKGTMFLADWTGHNVLAVDPGSKDVSVFVHSKAFNQPNDLCINSHNQLFASDPNWQLSTGRQAGSGVSIRIVH
jgi:sugar lactone lactonase YvrE